MIMYDKTRFILNYKMYLITKSTKTYFKQNKYVEYMYFKIKIKNSISCLHGSLVCAACMRITF